MQTEAAETIETAPARTSWNRNQPYPPPSPKTGSSPAPIPRKRPATSRSRSADSGIQYLPGDSAGSHTGQHLRRGRRCSQRLQLHGRRAGQRLLRQATKVRDALSSWLMIGKLSGSTVRQLGHTHADIRSSATWCRRATRRSSKPISGDASSSTSSTTPRRRSTTRSSCSSSCPRLAPRLYSISSSQALHPNSIDLSVRVVKYESHGRDRFGVCSAQIGERTPPGGVLPIFIHSNQLFRLPADPDGSGHHGRPRHGHRPLPRLP